MKIARASRYYLIGAFISAALLGGALAFQHYGKLAPCELCILQRWPHGIAIVLLLLAALSQSAWLAMFAALALLVGAAIALYHTGIERGFWEGPTACSGGAGPADVSADALFDQIMTAPLVRCDEVQWEFLTLSMASWNGIISLLAVYFIASGLSRA